MTSIPGNERALNQGGLMRCCLLTIMESTEPSEVGTVMPCKFESGTPTTMIVRDDGAWHWNQP